MSKVKVLHFTSNENDNCGIAKYQFQYIAALPNEVESKVFEVSPYQTRAMNPAELTAVMHKLATELKDYDVLHIQHEFGLFRAKEFGMIVDVARRLHKKVVITVHLSPGFAIKPAKRGGLGPRSILAYARARRHRTKMIEYHVAPMRNADVLIVHNSVTENSLKDFGIAPEKIQRITHPVYNIATPPQSTEIHERLDYQTGDIIYCITGFLHRYKGIAGAIKALKYLPPNYKLALLGGVKADSDQVEFEDAMTDLVDMLDLKDRVYISGFVKEDERLNALIRECDVCVYPYDRVYYSSLSSGSLNLAFANDKPVIAYPTETLKETAVESTGAVVLCETFAYYEIARELSRIDIPKQIELSKEYANKMAWPKMALVLAKTYQDLIA